MLLPANTYWPEAFELLAYVHARESTCRRLNLRRSRPAIHAVVTEETCSILVGTAASVFCRRQVQVDSLLLDVLKSRINQSVRMRCGCLGYC